MKEEYLHKLLKGTISEEEENQLFSDLMEVPEPKLSRDFTQIVVDKAMQKNAIRAYVQVLIKNILIAVGFIVAGGLIIRFFAQELFTNTLQFLLANKEMLIAVAIVIIMVQLADAIFVKRKKIIT